MPGCATTRLRYRGQTQKWCARAAVSPAAQLAGTPARRRAPTGGMGCPQRLLLARRAQSLPCCEPAASHVHRADTARGVHMHAAAAAWRGARPSLPARPPWRPGMTRPPPPHRCLMYFYGSEAEIDLDRHGEREFSEYAWLPLEDLPAKARLSGRTARAAEPRVLPATLRPASPPFRIMHVPRSIAGAA